MRLLHFSDIHINAGSFDWTDPTVKRALGFINLLVRRNRWFPRDLAQSVVDEILRQEVDAVIFSGDLTATGAPRDFIQVRDLMVPLIRKWGESFFLIPGNHDRYTNRTLQRELFERAFPSGRFADPLRPIRRQPLGDRLMMVGFDASIPRQISSSGRFSAPLADALDAELARQESDGRKVILVGHYPYSAPPEVHLSRTHSLEGVERLHAIIVRRKPILYLHGHKHRRWAIRPRETPDVLCVNSGSAGILRKDPLQRAGFVLIDLDDDFHPISVEARVAPLSLTQTASAFEKMRLA